MRVDWGVSSSEMDEYDPSEQYKPYDGPMPPNAVYHWRVKRLQYQPKTAEKNPSLWVGMELVPRRGRGETQYTGYYLTNFIPISAKTQFRYVPFLDAIGVSTRDFASRTDVDGEGLVRRIGKWRHTGDFIIAAALKDETDAKGQPRKGIGWQGPVTEETEYLEPGEDDDEDEEEYDYDEDTDDYDEELNPDDYDEDESF